MASRRGTFGSVQSRRVRVRGASRFPRLRRREAVGQLLLRYQAGLRLKDGHKLRFPASADPDGSLVFLCGTPEGSLIEVMESDKARQVERVARAASVARGQSIAELAGALVFDCICRKGILGDEFNLAVDAIVGELSAAKMAGFETMGEVALSVGHMSGFHNTTSVVVGFPTD